MTTGRKAKTNPTLVDLRRWERPGGVPDDDPYAPEAVAVYRLFNVPGALLYIGISDNPRRRFGQHWAAKPWSYQVASWTIEWLPSRNAALEEESRAITAEMPAYNINGMPPVFEDQAARWADSFARRQPRKADLDELFLTMMRLRSLGNDPSARRAWTEGGAFAAYRYGREQARRVDVHDHQRFIEQWNVEQEAAWRKHHREPEPPELPAWPRDENWRVRIGLWLIGRSSRIRRRFQSPGEIESRRRAAQARVRCTDTGIPASVCDCHSRHVADVGDEAKFGKPIGSPIGLKTKGRGSGQYSEDRRMKSL